MEQYYVIEVSTGDAQVEGKAMYGYADKTTALATYHQKLATAMKSALYETELVMVVDYKGNVLAREYFVREV